MKTIKDPLLKIEKLVTNYGVINAIRDIDIEVNEGELVSLLGANGSGKSTLLQSIIGTVKPKSGKILYNNEDIFGKQPHEIIAKGIAIVPEGRKIFVDATVYENLELGSFTREKDKNLDKEILEKVYSFFPILYERRSQLGGTLSGGEQQMLAIGRALMSNPRLILLDEPSMGLAPLVVKQVFKIIKEMKSMNITILLVEQNARMAIKISDRTYILNTGECKGELQTDDYEANQQIINAYLGS